MGFGLKVLSLSSGPTTEEALPSLWYNEGVPSWGAQGRR